MDIENVVTATWDPSVNAAYVYINPRGRKHGRTHLVQAIVMVDVDEQDEIIGIEILL